MSTFGEISWEDDVPGDRKENSKDLFLRLTEGSNELRLVTRPYQYLVHKYKKDSGNPKDFGTKVSCSAIHGNCPLCNQGNQAKPRWLLGVIERKTGTYKILDVGYAVFQQIRKLAKNGKWGDPTKYDIDVLVDPHGGATGYYTCQPLSKEPLSAQDQVLRDNVDLEELKRRVSPPTPDAVEKRLEKINSFSPGGQTVNTASPNRPTGNTNKTPPRVAVVDDTDDEFPDYAS
jgi:hypothetical protein